MLYHPREPCVRMRVMCVRFPGPEAKKPMKAAGDRPQAALTGRLRWPVQIRPAVRDSENMQSRRFMGWYNVRRSVRLSTVRPHEGRTAPKEADGMPTGADGMPTVLAASVPVSRSTRQHHVGGGVSGDVDRVARCRRPPSGPRDPTLSAGQSELIGCKKAQCCCWSTRPRATDTARSSNRSDRSGSAS